MNNQKTWVLIADSTAAKIYALYKARLFQDSNSKDNLELVSEFAHEASRKKTSELITDKMGEFGSGTFVENTAPKTHEAETFAMQLMLHLDSARKSNHFRELVLVAPPAFMGLLKKHMPHEVQKLLSQTIEKDYIHQTEKDLMHNLLNYF